jgi:hypothetical protein
MERDRSGADLLNSRRKSYAHTMDALHATIEEFAAEGFTHVQCYCPRSNGRADEAAAVAIGKVLK